MSQAMTVGKWVARQAARHGDELYALSWPSHRSISYSELAWDCQLVVNCLRALGSAPGDVVSVSCPMACRRCAYYLARCLVVGASIP